MNIDLYLQVWTTSIVYCWGRTDDICKGRFDQIYSHFPLPENINDERNPDLQN